MSKHVASFLSGVCASFVLLPGVMTYGMVCGAAAAAAGLPPSQAFAISWMVFVGSSQVVAAQLFASGAPGWVIVVTGWIVSLRFMMTGAALAPHLRDLSAPWRWFAAYLLTDHAFAMTLSRIHDNRLVASWFYLGVAFFIWLGWQASNLAGIVLGVLIPASWSIEFVVALTFIGLLVPLLRDRYMAAAALAGGGAAVLLDLPMKLNIIAAAPAGIVVALVLEKVWPKSPSGE